MIQQLLIFKAAMTELLKTKRQSSAIQSKGSKRSEIATDDVIKKVEKNFTFWQQLAQQLHSLVI